MSSWSEIAWAPEAVEPERAELKPLPVPELRSGTWTRFGGERVLGDAITEEALNVLAENTQQAARAQGYTVGWAEGQRAARAAAEVKAGTVEQARAISEARRSEEHAEALAALELAAEELRKAVTDTCAKIERQASHLAWELVRTIVGHERTSLDAVRRALALAPDADLARLRLHPRDAEIAGAHAEVLEARGITVVGDHGLDRGDALVEAGDSITDLRIDSALDRVRTALGEDPA
ncbi:FliH/SctL family protein [Marmoricola sp. RAF53]|uniref:FliH/SctL family protein n=1 Tax=Marmoricola sp. RAF53 TaxID=3233059 RepID=UPI003F9DF93E